MSGVVAYLNQRLERIAVQVRQREELHIATVYKVEVASDELAALARIALAAKEVDRVLGTYALDDQMLVPECKEMRSALAELSRVVDQQSRT